MVFDMENLDNIFKKKYENPYKVRVNQHSTKDVDLSKRTVTGMFNSYFFIDSDLDMLIPGAASKSIQERGAGSQKGNKIKHLKDHDWNKNIARLDVLVEKDVDFNGRTIKGIYHESFYPESTDSNDQLIKIQSGLYDDRSIGFRYMNIVLAEKDSQVEEYRKNWDLYYPLALNPEVVTDGFFFIVKEIKLYEGSDVAFGANELTPLLGVKSADKITLFNELSRKLDIMTDLFKTGNLTDEGFHKLEMEKLQIKSYLGTIITSEPSIKDTLLAESRKQKDTQKSNDLINFYKNLKY